MGRKPHGTPMYTEQNIGLHGFLQMVYQDGVPWFTKFLLFAKCSPFKFYDIKHFKKSIVDMPSIFFSKFSQRIF